MVYKIKPAKAHFLDVLLLNLIPIKNNCDSTNCCLIFISNKKFSNGIFKYRIFLGIKRIYFILNKRWNPIFRIFVKVEWKQNKFFNSFFSSNFFDSNLHSLIAFRILLCICFYKVFIFSFFPFFFFRFFKGFIYLVLFLILHGFVSMHIVSIRNP